MTSLETARSLANGPIVAGGWEGIPRGLQRLLSLIGCGSTGGVCVGGILFTGRQICSLYLLLWLCGAISRWARSLEWRHAVTLHILVGKISISFFLFYCEGMLSLVVLWLCGFIVNACLTPTGFSIILYHRYDSRNYIRLG